MKKIYTFLFAGISAMGFSQMFVSPNSFVYVNDQIVYVKQDVNLQNNGNFYLRNEAQLLQGTTAASTNTGLGRLSVFQEGTSDNFDYNYWCSPVGNPSASIGNDNFGITLLSVPTSLTASTAAIALAPTVHDGLASPFSIASEWIYKFIVSNSYAQWIFVGSANTIAAGQGFTMKGTSGTDATVVNGVANNPGSAQRYDFRGKPNDGNIAVSLGANQLTLTGNPYPSALHVNAFLLDATNTACTGIAYYWEQNKTVNSHYLVQYQGGYGTYAPISLLSNGIYVPATFDTYDGSGNLNTTGTSSGLVIERKHAPIGQGFMIKGLTAGTVTLRNTHRLYYKESGALSQFERLAAPTAENVASDDVPQIRINTILNNQNTRQIALAFVPEATDGVDRGIDGFSPADETLPADVYFVIENDKYVIQGINFDVDKRLPLGVKSAANSTFRFYIPEVLNFDPNQQVYIFDANDNSYHNIKSGTFDVTLEAGVYENRFEVTFKDGQLSSNDIKDQHIDVIQNNNLQYLSVHNPNNHHLKSCQLFDMAGKLVLTENRGSAMDRISTSALSEGVYIAKVNSDHGELTKKVTISRQY